MQELAPRGIRINAVAPGLVHTSSVAKMVGSEEAAAKIVERAARANPSGRETRDADYASVVKFLLSPEAEFVQGQVIQAIGAMVFMVPIFAIRTETRSAFSRWVDIQLRQRVALRR